MSGDVSGEAKFGAIAGNLTRRERAGMFVIASILALVGILLWFVFPRVSRGDSGVRFLTSEQVAKEPARVPGAGPVASPMTWTLGNGPPPDSLSGVSPPSTSPKLVSKPASDVVVYVCGAVRSPGLYTCKSGERLWHAIRRAGGLRRDASAESLNLAERVVDAMQIRVPTRGEVKETIGGENPVRSSATAAVAKPAVSPGASAGSGKFRTPADGQIDMNTATDSEWQRLPGIGPGMSARILAYRAQVGRFQSKEELRDVPGVGEKKYAQWEGFLKPP